MLKPIWSWVQENPQWIGVFVYSILECAIGKTKKLESNSLIEVLGKILSRKKL